ncbi:MAG: hypothetical protein Q7R48_02725 [bacterium]|nr:hypothetical protein [bacterium]
MVEIISPQDAPEGVLLQPVLNGQDVGFPLMRRGDVVVTTQGLPPQMPISSLPQGPDYGFRLLG